MNAAARHPSIEFWFDFGSIYSYLSAMRIEQESTRQGLAVSWKPFLLGPIFRDLGFETSPFVLQKEKGAYVWQDMARQCRKYGLRWTQPTTFPRLSVLASRIGLLGEDEPWIGEFCRRVMERNFADDQNIDHRDHLVPLLRDLGLPAQKIVDEAQSDTIKARLHERTAEARDKRIFGAPTFFAGSEMFWGNDRLDEALHYIVKKLKA